MIIIITVIANVNDVMVVIDTKTVSIAFIDIIIINTVINVYMAFTIINKINTTSIIITTINFNI